MIPRGRRRSFKSWLGLALIALYPHAHRVRYGEELRALLEQSRVTAGMLFDLLRGALDAHLWPGGLIAPPPKRMRGTVSAALTLWIALALVGSGFAKTTEDLPFRAAEAAHPWLGGARIAVQVFALAGAAIVLVAGAPLAISILRQAWRDPSRALRRALSVPILAVGGYVVLTAVLLLVVGHRRDSAPGHLAFVLWIALAVVVAGVCAGCARAALENARLRVADLALAAAAAWLLARVMAALTVATALYGVLLAVDAHALEAVPNGPLRIGTGVSLALQVAAMVVISALALVTGRRGLRAASAR